MVDISRALKTAVATGKIRFGIEETKRAIDAGTAKLVIVSENCPDISLRTGELKTKRIVYPGDNAALGAACGKPFSISSLVVLDAGSSDILSA
ncbi:MAG: 50S ribosomal protein L30e [Thermoplasmata archaeon]|nr:50S ribosomal protein L30e [Thermoplasmata archaeon]